MRPKAFQWTILQDKSLMISGADEGRTRDLLNAITAAWQWLHDLILPFRSPKSRLPTGTPPKLGNVTYYPGEVETCAYCRESFEDWKARCPEAYEAWRRSWAQALGQPDFAGPKLPIGTKVKSEPQPPNRKLS